MPYHINPETGNANICKAKIKCKYVALGDPHFETKIAAQKFYEKKMKSPISRAAELAIRRTQLQTKILDYAQQLKDDGLVRFDDELTNLILIRNKIDTELTNIANNDFHGAIQQIVILENHNPPKQGKPYLGFDNSLDNHDSQVSAMLTQFEKASTAWVSSLSDSEVRAVRAFSSASDSYKLYGESEDSKHFEKALSKAPHFEKPLTVYSGLSTEMVKYFAHAQKGETVNIDRGLSTTLNPGQINAFSWNKEGGRYALVIEATKGSPMYSVSSNPHECEIVLQSGDFEIVDVEENQLFSYTTPDRALTYDKVFKVRQIVD